jgi:hypothetical protein
MATNRSTLIRAIISSARTQAAAQGKTLTQVLRAVRDGRFSSDLINGRTVISTSEAGGSVTFNIPTGMQPLEVMTLFQEALDYCASFPDPDNPKLCSNRIMRLRVSFAKATV